MNKHVTAAHVGLAVALAACAPTKRSDQEPTPESGAMRFDGLTGTDPDAGAAIADASSPALTDDTGLWVCPSRVVPSSARTVGGLVTRSMAWSGTVHVTKDLNIYGGSRLSIAPGTVVIVGPDVEIRLGGIDADTLTAAGTQDEPIRFCGRQARPGYWKGLTIAGNVTTTSLLKHLLIADAGQGRAALDVDAEVTLKNVQVRNARDVGVQASTFYGTSSELSVEGTKGRAVVLTDDDAVTRFPVGGLLTNNADNVAAVEFRAVDATTVFNAIGIPFLFVRDFSFGDVDVFFEAGVEVHMTANRALRFASDGKHLMVNGTAEQPVIFRGVVAQPGYWRGISIGDEVATSSRIEHAIVQDAGGGSQYALDVGARVTLADVTLTNNEQGMHVDSQGLKPDSTAITVQATSTVPLTVEAPALPSLPPQFHLEDNEDAVVVVHDRSGPPMSGIIQDLGVPYLLSDNLRVEADVELEVAPGTQFLLGEGTTVRVDNDGALIAAGEVDNPIEFRGAEAQPGWWAGLEIARYASSNTRLEHVLVADAGGSGWEASLYLQQPISVSHCTFANSAGYGISKEPVDTTDYTLDNTFESTALGDQTTH